MELSVERDQPVSNSYSKNDTNSFEGPKQDIVEKLRERILELELELQKQKTAAEKGEKLLKVMWGDDFNDYSLH
ncbi:hypothetical protein [Segetibacter aerophilus]|uniref:Uncharacterized protein n=1 Tax=Segetibacter aerophilus TaxID=670293 RepID=A0A512B8S0_9BACT|nr:hypothetical protein [Segetibacter aerophilus]GEO08365.1 hypothetical protein SAE01_08610 [Segetibacter aerophilus]